jgi:hypothetical protein
VQDAHQPQHPPPQQPPPTPPAGAGALLGPLAADVTPVTAMVGSRRTVSVCPFGQGAGSSMFAIEREISNVSPQERHRMS